MAEVPTRLETQHVAIAAGLVELQDAVDQHAVDSPDARRHSRWRVGEVVDRINSHLDEEEEALVPLLNALGPMSEGPVTRE